MRALIPLLCLVVCGCTSRVTRQQITDSTGSNRLALIDVRISSVQDILAGQQSYDFNSLVWRTKPGWIWHDRVTISRAAFQGTRPRERWVSEIHSLDAAKGSCIIKVAEGDVPKGSSNVIRYIYSWREWSLLTNGEVRLLRVCANPFEKYQP
ncbi:MAG TPA: hypothetical protein VKM56_00900 [Verrucomicrobiae bacterium]|nr:hypothetical protein [Verrucomicrobiae bacterium]